MAPYGHMVSLGCSYIDCFQDIGTTGLKTYWLIGASGLKTKKSHSLTGTPMMSWKKSDTVCLLTSRNPMSCRSQQGDPRSAHQLMPPCKGGTHVLALWLHTRAVNLRLFGLKVGNCWLAKWHVLAFFELMFADFFQYLICRILWRMSQLPKVRVASESESESDPSLTAGPAAGSKRWSETFVAVKPAHEKKILEIDSKPSWFEWRYFSWGPRISVFKCWWNHPSLKVLCHSCHCLVLPQISNRQ